MLLKFKNKHILALEKLIADSDNMGGIIAHIILDPKEAAGLILEIVDLGKKYTGDICIKEDGEDITIRKLLMGGLRLDKNEGIKDIVNQWYKTHYKVEYKGIPLKVVKPADWYSSKDAVDVPKPKGPLADVPDLNVKAPGSSPPPDQVWTGNTWAPAPPQGSVRKEGELDVPKPPPAGQQSGATVFRNPIYSNRMRTKEMNDSIENEERAARLLPTWELDVPKPPPPPPGRLISEGGIVGQCHKCGSSLKSKWIFFKRGGCIQPECTEYWQNDKWLPKSKK